MYESLYVMLMHGCRNSDIWSWTYWHDLPPLVSARTFEVQANFFPSEKKFKEYFGIEIEVFLLIPIESVNLKKY